MTTANAQGREYMRALQWPVEAFSMTNGFTCANLCASLLLLLVLDKLDVILWYLLVLFNQELLQLHANITLHHNLLSSTREFGYRRAGSKFLAKVLCNLGPVQYRNLACVKEFADSPS